ncbi:MAG: hypothetical protein ACLR8P_22630 [Clostridium fessum]
MESDGAHDRDEKSLCSSPFWILTLVPLRVQVRFAIGVFLPEPCGRTDGGSAETGV